MGYTDNMSPEMKQRIVQELVPGKQTFAGAYYCQSG